MKYTVYRNNLKQLPRMLIGKVNTQEAAEKLIELDRASLDSAQEMLVFGQVSWSIFQTKSDPEPSGEPDPQSQS